MADIKISDMDPWVGAVTGDVEFPAVYANQNYRIALSQLTVDTLGFGSMALQDSNTVSITGGNVAVTALSGAITIANGGTGLGDTPTNGQLLIGNGADYTLATLTAGANIGITNTAGGIEIAVIGAGSGTVTSVELDPGTTGLTVGGANPITTAGTFTLGGVVAVSHGGTGQSSFTDGQLLIGNTTGNTLSKSTLTAGANVTITNGAGAITISSTDQYVGTVTSVSALTIGTAGTDLTSTVANGTTTPAITLNVPTASSVNRGALSPTDWSTFNNKQAALTAGTGISLAGNAVTNTAPDQVVAFTNGTGISVTGTYPAFTVTNTAPDQVVALTAGTNITITGSYPNFTIAAAGGGGGSGTVTSVDASGGTTGMTFTGGPITTSGTLTLGGTLGVPNGGTGATTFTANAVLKGNGAAAVSASSNLYSTTTGVGVGTSTPATRLHVVGSAAADAVSLRIQNEDNTGYGAIDFSNGGVIGGYIWVGNENYAGPGLGGSINYSANGGSHIWYQNYVQQMQMDTSGNLCIGDVPSGTYKLEVAGAGFANSMVLGAALPVSSGGTGQVTYTNGQLLIGNTTGGTLTKATLTQGTGITITNGAGSITVANALPMTYPGAGIAVSTGSAWTTSLTAPSGAIVGTTDTQTLTNKRITARVNAQTTTASPWSWNSDSYDQQSFSALANALTINADAGTPTDGQKAMLRFKDDGTARALTWTTGATNAFRAIGVTLPTTTVISKTLYVGCVYNAADSRWDVVAVAQEA